MTSTFEMLAWAFTSNFGLIQDRKPGYYLTKYRHKRNESWRIGPIWLENNFYFYSLHINQKTRKQSSVLVASFIPIRFDTYDECVSRCRERGLIE